jgi:hypothetical protein
MKLSQAELANMKARIAKLARTSANEDMKAIAIALTILLKDVK